MSRSYTKVRPKAHHVYLVEGVMELFAVSRNTVSNWVRQGLRPSDSAQPYVFRGAELIRFHKVREAMRTGLARGFFHCMRCKEAVVPQLSELSISEEGPKVFRARARCPDCGAALSKLLGETECTMFRNCLATNTSLDSIVEEIIENPAGIGKFRPHPDDEISRNDRLLMQWLGHAGRYDPKTVTAHLASIRAFEAFVGGKSFAILTVQDAENWRSTMIATEGGGLSRGTLRHRASHLRLFFGWLGKQTGYRNLAALEACFDLPRRFQAKAIPQPRAWPEMEEAVAMLKAMPADTLIDQRARAIFALAFLTGFRADALITVRLRHIDLKGRKAIHDGKEMRTKNGKSFVVHWFPRTDAFAAAVEDWVGQVTNMGLRPNDALFPEIRMLQQAADPERRDAIEPMQSISAVTDAFRLASRGATQDYSPHSARHTLAHLGDQLCRTGEQRKAWSLNLGHSSEAITWAHYGKISDTRRDEVFEAFDEEAPATSTEAELMLAYHEHCLMRGTREFDLAEELVERRKAERRNKRAAT